MFVALYEMKIKAGKECEFETAWADWTDAIYRVRGSYGSRLHRTQIPGVYIAYAQWPSQEIYDLPTEGFTEKEKESSRRMHGATVETRIGGISAANDSKNKI